MHNVSMGFSYKPLLKLLVDRNMKETDLRKELGLSSATLAKLGKGEPLSGANIAKLCNYFRCQIGEIVEITWDDTVEAVDKRGRSASFLKKARKRK